MTEVVLSPILQVIFDRLASPFLRHLRDLLNLEKNFQELENTIPLVQAVLEDAEEQQLTNKAVKIWLTKLNDAAYDAQDLLDLLAAKYADYRPGSYGYLSMMQEKTENAEKARKMLKVLEETALEGLKLNLKEGKTMDRKSDRRETSSFVMKSEVYGREEDKEKIVGHLLSCEADQEEENMSYVLIIGMGGLGKTTLAQLAYNDERVTRHFDIKVWVFVSEDFNAKRIMKTIIECLTKDECRYTEMDRLQSKLQGLLHKKRYLIVLDDVWTEDQENWDKLKPLFYGGVDGSKIIITTRNKKLIFVMDSPNLPYYLKVLPEEDCWSLFKQRAFRQGEEGKYPNLVRIGRQIAKKCGGVPLAAKIIGSLMRFKRQDREWLFVQNSELWNLDVCQMGIMPALKLSYFHLPSHLKHCFAFCSIFPKGYEIKKEKLIQLWMAQGLIRLDGGSIPPEDIGLEYFDDLLWMSFFEESEKCENGIVTGYRMHDIIHDLAHSVAGNEYTTLEHGIPLESLTRTRHASVVCDYRSSTIPQVLSEAKHLRTLLLFPGGNMVDIPRGIFSSFSCLRALDMNASGLETVDVHIGRSLCLRYLDLSFTPIKSLPPRIWELPFLQTLNLIGCYNLKKLPYIARMISLRHLDITGCEALTSMCPKFDSIYKRCGSFSPNKMEREEFIRQASLPGSSNQLQILPIIIVGGFLDIEFLGQLNLRGELKIIHLENLWHGDDTKNANLTKKGNLESLGLYWGNCEENSNLARGIQLDCKSSSSEESEAESQRRQQRYSLSQSQEHELDSKVGEQVIKGLQPHQNLKMLTVKGYPGIRFPPWTLPNLISVKLSYCKNCENLPVLGNLVFLKTLSLCGMHSVKCTDKEFYGESTQSPFPSLEELVLSDFPRLEEWISANERDPFPSLTKLTVDKCPKLTSMPSSLSLKHLELRGCNMFIFNSFRNLSSLENLVIEKFPELVSLPGWFLANNLHLTSLEILSCHNLCSLPAELGHLSALKSLTIRWCVELYSLPEGMQNLKALQTLEISDCHSVISLTGAEIGGLSSLRTLSIENCSMLTYISNVRDLTSLEHLTIMYCPSLGALPEGLHYLNSLRSLTILSCPELPSLPEELQYVKTLHYLEIRSCPSLKVLPEWIENLSSLRSLTISDCLNLKQLPNGMKHLCALQHLSIQDCPAIEKRCKEGSGKDWPKIAHVPHKYIGAPVLEQSNIPSSSSAG